MARCTAGADEESTAGDVVDVMPRVRGAPPGLPVPEPLSVPSAERATTVSAPEPVPAARAPPEPPWDVPGPEDAGPDGLGPETPEPEDAEPEDAEPEDPEPEDVDPEDAEPEDPEPEDPEPDDAEPDERVRRATGVADAAPSARAVSERTASGRTASGAPPCGPSPSVRTARSSSGPPPVPVACGAAGRVTPRTRPVGASGSRA
ncbi:hypothetical protein ACFZAG_19175 [Streptomyces sp. NPDC012403]|uniref:hypothetical protein n=1 Tax=Streptomyces sp. NPDC012403 TaxID=3364831 RepID=UPI0036E5A6F8